MASSIGFVTFGMFIIDEIEYTNNKQRQQDLIGGAGTYAVLGARIISGKEYASTVSWIVDKGSDFPANFTALIDSWKTTCIYRTDQTRLTTKAWNGYGPNDHRDFKYLTPKIRLEVKSLTDEQALSKSFHMVCSPSRCKDLTSKLNQRRENLTTKPTGQYSNPIIIWEPIPDLCTPAELFNLQIAASKVSVVSPNADELAQFFDDTTQSKMTQDEMVQRLMNWNWENNTETTTNAVTETDTSQTHVIIREGAAGSTIYFAPSSSSPPKQIIRSHLTKLHLPAYHTTTTTTTLQKEVIDPTGGGNTYLGALAIGLSGTSILNSRAEKLINELLFKPIKQHQHRHVFQSSKDYDDYDDYDEYDEYDNDHDIAIQPLKTIIKASIYAVIAASYAIEQSGVPYLQDFQDGEIMTEEKEEKEEEEKWNGEAFTVRLERYLLSEGMGLVQQFTGLTH